MLRGRQRKLSIAPGTIWRWWDLGRVSEPGPPLGARRSYVFRPTSTNTSGPYDLARRYRRYHLGYSSRALAYCRDTHTHVHQRAYSEPALARWNAGGTSARIPDVAGQLCSFVYRVPACRRQRGTKPVGFSGATSRESRQRSSHAGH